MTPHILWLPYIANIVILVPVVWMMFGAQTGPTLFGGDVENSEGLRLLVGSLWFAILLASVAGLFAPHFFRPVLLIQIVYKATWLAAFVMPLWMRGGEVPWGIAVIFAAIVAIWPFFFWASAEPHA